MPDPAVIKVLNPVPGTHIEDALVEAIMLSIKENCAVQVAFNGRDIYINMRAYINQRLEEFHARQRTHVSG
jgi:hypothetical protein